MNLHRPPAHCLSPARAHKALDPAVDSTRYARMFPELPPFRADEAFLRTIGCSGGVCECSDGLDTPSSLSGVAAGWPIFGQLVAHDITADRSALKSHADPEGLRNARAPRLDLECLYGDGPAGHPFLYQRSDSAKFLLGAGGADVPRNSEGIAIIGDPRNDSHMLMAQMHLAMLKTHNMFVDEARAEGVSESHVFESAARNMRWHYQWTVLKELLPSLVGSALVDAVLRDGAKWFRPADGVFIPLEFADAAYRYGHCQIRHTYLLNHETEPVPVFPDLLGFRPVPQDRAIDWSLFFDVGGARTAQRAKKIDGKLVGSLIRLPIEVTGEVEDKAYHSLAVRDLQRGQGTGLPSGEAVAHHIGARPLTPEEVGLRTAGWDRETPLWYYILRESDVTTGGESLGPVGGTIVAEVMITLLDRDPTSVRNAGRGFEPRGSWADLLLQNPVETSRAGHGAAMKRPPRG